MTQSKGYFHSRGVSYAEFIVVLAIILVIGGGILRVVYADSIEEIEKEIADWFFDTFGFSQMWLFIPIVLLYVCWRYKSDKRS